MSRISPQLNLMHAEYFAGIGKYDYASLTLPLKDNKRTLGLTLLRFAVDDIPNTVFLVQPDGSIDFSNITTFSSADYAFLISLAQQVDWIKNTKMNFGINAKIIHRLAGDFTTSWGFGFDAAVQVIGDRRPHARAALVELARGVQEARPVAEGRRHPCSETIRSRSRAAPASTSSEYGR